MKILVMRPGALGDVLLTLPALQSLRAKFPEAAIEVMGDISVLQFLRGRSVIAAVSSFDRADLATLFQPAPTPTECLRSYLNQFDLILSYATSPEHAFARNLASIARGTVLSFAARPALPLGMHMSEYLQQPLRALGVTICNAPPLLELTVADQREAEQWWKEHGLGKGWTVAIHPGSGSTAKNWPSERFAAVARLLQCEHGAHIILLSGPADARAISETRLAMQGLEYVLLHNSPLPLLAAILSRCQVYLGNDSGVSHLAAAVGVPTMVIFGPTDPGAWAPRGASVSVMQGKAACAPCSAMQQQGCCRRLCLESVSVDMVLTALLSKKTCF